MGASVSSSIGVASAFQHNFIFRVHQNQTIEKVFRTVHILKVILTCAILNANGKIDAYTVKSLRLVSKYWLQTVTDCLYDINRLESLAEDDDDNEDYDREEKRVHNMVYLNNNWEEFVNCWTDPNRIINTQMLPFSIRLGNDYHNNCPINILQKVLEKCSDGLVKLEINIKNLIEDIEEWPSTESHFTPVRFPNLARVAIKYFHVATPEAELIEKQVFQYIQCLFKSRFTSPLKITVQFRSRNPIPSFSAQLRFPKETSHFYLNYWYPQASEHFQQVIAANTGILCNLELLHIYHWHSFQVRPPLPANVLYNFLSTNALTLKKLVLDANFRPDDDLIKPTLQFELPILRKLEILKVYYGWGFDPEFNKSLDISARRNSRLSNLRLLLLDGVPRNQIRFWINQYQCVKLETLRVYPTARDYCQLYSINTAEILGIKKAFPNVISLGIAVGFPAVRVNTLLRSVFAEMGKLEHLRILIDPNLRVDLDAVLIGCDNPETMSQLRQEYSQHGTVTLFQEDSYVESIRSMKCLNSLDIYVDNSPRVYDEVLYGNKLSGLAFECAFFRMQNLQQLDIDLGPFYAASEEVEKKWRAIKGYPLVVREYSESEDDDEDEDDDETTSSDEEEDDE